MENVHRYAKDVFCACCGQQIDTFRNDTGEDHGQAEALVIGVSRRIHMREAGCEGIDEVTGAAWTFGPWRDTTAEKSLL